MLVLASATSIAILLAAGLTVLAVLGAAAAGMNRERRLRDTLIEAALMQRRWQRTLDKAFDAPSAGIARRALGSGELDCEVAPIIDESPAARRAA